MNNNYIETPMMLIKDKLISLKYPHYTLYNLDNPCSYVGDESIQAIYNTLYNSEVGLFNNGHNKYIYIVGYLIRGQEENLSNGIYGTIVDYTHIHKDMSCEEFTNALISNSFNPFTEKYNKKSFSYFEVSVNDVTLFKKYQIIDEDIYAEQLN